MKKATTIAGVATAMIFALSACTVDDSTNDNKANEAGSTTHIPEYTVPQQNAILAAKNYLSMGTGFSRAGLIEQLTSKAGNGFRRATAVFAVNHIKVNWKKQAVLSAKSYVSLGTGFSRSSLIEQLTSKAGSQFTLAQAEHAATKVGF